MSFVKTLLDEGFQISPIKNGVYIHLILSPGITGERILQILRTPQAIRDKRGIRHNKIANQPAQIGFGAIELA